MAAHRPPWPSLLDGLITQAAPSAPKAASGARKAPRAAQPRQPRLRTLTVDAKRLQSIATVCRHLHCELVQFQSAGEPACFFLGHDVSLLDESRGMRASPQFRSVEALEYFCRANLSAFLALEALPEHPREWFWNRS
jgi:hypothetical protein